MKGLNKIELIGNLGQDPEIVNLENNSKLARFSVATSEKYSDRNGNIQTTTEWHKVICWNKLADIAEKYITKGDKIFIEGKMTYRKYTNNDGFEVQVAEIVSQNLIMLNSK